MLFCLNVFGGKSSTNSCLRILYSLLIEVHYLAKSPYVVQAKKGKQSNPRGEMRVQTVCVIGDFLVCIVYSFAMGFHMS